ncbi:MAG: hypothetical protein ACRC8B_22830 [Aeromonas sobria]|uniref:ParE family toxin-like protein n=1 Tax=Aeromonas sobria TaxID=646 RepID=UPI003F34D620
MEKLTVGRGFAPQIVERAAQALKDGVRRPILASNKQWKMVNVGYRHRLLLRGDGKAELMTHESILKYLSHRSRNCK